jgi:hypothetical protein
LTAFYSERTVEALNQFSAYTRHTPTNRLDLRCEFDLPRFKDLKKIKKPSETEEYSRFLWFQTEHDFTTPSNPKIEENLRLQIVNLTIRDIQMKKKKEE